MSVTAEEVRQIMSSFPLDGGETYLLAASLDVTERLANKGLSDDRLKLIETYLAAHYAVISLEGGGLKSAKRGEAEEEYFSPADTGATDGFGLTRFGQQAIAFDTSGTLSKVSTKKPARFRVM